MNGTAIEGDWDKVFESVKKGNSDQFLFVYKYGVGVYWDELTRYSQTLTGTGIFVNQ